MSLGIITYLDIVHQKKVRHVLHFSMKHGIMITDNKIEPSERSAGNTSSGHNSGYSRYPVRVLRLAILYDNDSRAKAKRQA